MWNVNVQNMVASCQLANSLDLNKILEKLPNTKYDPHTFPGLIYRIKDPKTSVLLFRSGKAVFTGATTMDMLNTSVDRVMSDLREIDANVLDEPIVELQNMVCSAEMGADVNLNVTAMALGLEKVEYEPEQFPGLVYRMNDPKVVILLFGSGKIVIAGAKKFEDAERAADELAKELRDIGIIG